MMQKNETQLLEPWLKYYGYMFGFENLEIIDNGSTDELVISTLKTYERAGCAIHRQYSTPAHYLRKGDIIRDIILDWDITKDYDFALPVDCDEFLCVMPSDHFSCRRDVLHQHFNELFGLTCPIRIRSQLMNVPGEAGWFFFEPQPKCIFARNTIEHLDHGFHHPKTKSGENAADSKFVIAHLHNKAHHHIVSFAKQKLALRVDLNDLDAVRSYRGDGEHLVEYILASVDKYNSKYEKSGTFYFRDLVHLFKALSIDLADTLHEQGIVPDENGHLDLTAVKLPNEDGSSPTVVYLDAEFYRARYKDVKANGIAPLLHYLGWGCKEGRLPSLDPGLATARVIRD